MSDQQADFNLIIDSRSLQKGYLKDLLSYGELFYFFAWRDILVRYKQTFLGIAWALIRPLLNMVVFVFVFGKLANLPSDGVPYSVFVLAGMLPWQLFSSCLVDSSNSLVQNAPMISKVYFPRIILPISHILVNFVDFLISLTLVSVLFIVLGTVSYWTILLLPVFILFALILCLGTSLWLSALTVRYRDFRFLIPFIAQFGMFISPVGYGSFLISEQWHWLYFLNPMAGVIEAFRWACFGVYHDYLPLALGLSLGVNLILLGTGFRFFRKMERLFADII